LIYSFLYSVPKCTTPHPKYLKKIWLDTLRVKIEVKNKEFPITRELATKAAHPVDCIQYQAWQEIRLETQLLERRTL